MSALVSVALFIRSLRAAEIGPRRIEDITAGTIDVEVQAGEVEPGFRTPASAFGAAFIEGIEGCRLEIG